MNTPALAQCPCDPDMDGNGFITNDDILLLVNCVGQPPIGECEGADIDCDGDIDCCDVQAMICVSNGGGEECCDDGDPATCHDGACLQETGACCLIIDPWCAQITEEQCADLDGRYQGDETTCADDDGDGVPDECEDLSIPAVSEWGLVVMALLMLTAGTVVFARRRRPTAQ